MRDIWREWGCVKYVQYFDWTAFVSKTDHLRDLGVCARIILKWILGQWNVLD
jgi:hypothetical protein